MSLRATGHRCSADRPVRSPPILTIRSCRSTSLETGGYITYHHDMFQTGYGTPSIPPSGIPDPEFSPYHRAVLEFIAHRERYQGSGCVEPVTGVGMRKLLRHGIGRPVPCLCGSVARATRTGAVPFHDDNKHGIVATSQTLASAAAAKILERGGSAADAAIAANAMIGVVEPMMDGVGGDLMVLYWDAKTRKLYGLNASGWAPEALTIDSSRQGSNESQRRDPSSPVPGAVDGWSKLHKRFGRLPLGGCLQAGDLLCGEGYPVTERISDYWWHRTDHLKTNKEGRGIFLRGDMPPAVGEVFRNARLADTLSLIAQGGADAFYRGPIAKSILPDVGSVWRNHGC